MVSGRKRDWERTARQKTIGELKPCFAAGLFFYPACAALFQVAVRKAQKRPRQSGALVAFKMKRMFYQVWALYQSSTSFGREPDL